MKKNWSFFYQYKFLVLFILMISCGGKEDHAAKKKEIEHLITQCFDLTVQLKVKELVSTSRIILAKSEKINDEKGKCYAYFYMARSLSLVGKYNESNAMLQKAVHFKAYLATDDVHQANIYTVFAGNYMNLGLNALSFSYLHRALNLLKKSTLPPASTAFLFQRTYSMFGQQHTVMSQPDSAYYYLNKSRYIIKKFDKKVPELIKASCYLSFGYYHMDVGNVDSCHYYLDKSIEIMHPVKHPTEIYSLEAKGFQYALQNENEKAIVYYKKAINAGSPIIPMKMSGLYDNISKAYSSINNQKLARFYHEKYLFLLVQEKKKVDKNKTDVLNEIFKENKKEQDDLNRKKTYKYYALIVLFLLIALFVFYLLRRNKKRNKKESLIAEQVIAEKESVITQKQEENTVLQLKVNDSFEELIQLAKSNSPEFFARFQEVYPDFVPHVFAVSPSMRVSELTLCAYIFLGFTTKDIALYTFKSIHTIQGRKSNLRKKFNLLPEEAFELWLKKLMS